MDVDVDVNEDVDENVDENEDVDENVDENEDVVRACGCARPPKGARI